VALAIGVHLALAVWLIRGAPAWNEAAGRVEPPLPVVFIRPQPQIVPAPAPPPPAPEPAMEPAPVAAEPGEAAEPYRPRRPDLVFVIEDPDDADSGEPRVAGTAGVSLPEVATESQEEARRIGEMPRKGWVVLRVLVRRDGTVDRVEPQEGGDPEAAVRMSPAVKALRFRPALQQGRAVDAWFTLAWPPA
jgi:hypothetical protein